MKKQYHVSIRQEFNPRDGREYRITINRESLTVNTKCAMKLWGRIRYPDADLDGGIITLSGILEVNR